MQRQPRLSTFRDGLAHAIRAWTGHVRKNGDTWESLICTRWICINFLLNSRRDRHVCSGGHVVSCETRINRRTLKGRSVIILQVAQWQAWKRLSRACERNGFNFVSIRNAANALIRTQVNCMRKAMKAQYSVAWHIQHLRFTSIAEKQRQRAVFSVYRRKSHQHTYILV